MPDIKLLLSCLASKDIQKKQKQAIISSLSKDDIDEIGKMVEDILAKKIRLPKSELIKMRRNKLFLYSLIRGNKLSCKQKKQVLEKKGKFIANQIIKLT